MTIPGLKWQVWEITGGNMVLNVDELMKLKVHG